MSAAAWNPPGHGLAPASTRSHAARGLRGGRALTRRGAVVLVLMLPAAWVLPAAPAAAAKRTAAKHATAHHEAGPGTLEVARAFEAARALPQPQRLAQLQQLDAQLSTLLHGDAEPEQRAALHALSGAVAFERGDYAAAQRAYGKSLDAAKGGRYADDAAFAIVRSLEAQGRDADAEHEWLEWEKHYPTSSLLPEARLARAWNALRRGD